MNGKTGQKPNGKSVQLERYGRAVDSVLLDKELSASARVVYPYLARGVFEGSTVSVGTRKIASDLGFHQETVVRALKELVTRKHISVFGSGAQRKLYLLHSNQFGQKQGKEDVMVSGPRSKRLVSLDNERHGLEREIA